jgi:phospho-N-acetylmuramoyl-pentapeptide-transferase
MLPAIYDFWLKAFEQGEAWARAFPLPQSVPIHHLPRGKRGDIGIHFQSLLIGPRVIRKLISLKVGQPIRTAEEVHKLAELHGGKIGTPTMGGVLISARC